MNLITKKSLFIITASLIGCFSFSSCHQSECSQHEEKSSKRIRPANVLNSNLFEVINFEDIPLIEDDLGTFTAQIHNEAVEFILDYLENNQFDIFTNSQSENSHLFTEIEKICVNEFSYEYSLDTIGFYIIANSSANNSYIYLENDSSDMLYHYVQIIDNLCNEDNINSLSNIYGSYGEITDNRQRLIYKIYAAVIEQSYNHWALCSYTPFSFLPQDIIIQYQYPECPPLFSDSPREINWQNVAKADGKGALDGAITAAITHGIMYLAGGAISWAEFAIEVGVHAAVQSIKAYIKESETCTIEVLNTNHSYFYNHDNFIYNYMLDHYQTEGAEYFINNWEGRFEFMISNF